MTREAEDAMPLGRGGRPLQVVFVIDDEDSIFIIHARPLTDKEKKRYRKRATT